MLTPVTVRAERIRPKSSACAPCTMCPLGQRNRRPWLNNQAALMNTEQEGARSGAGQPRR
jgi:hypothetical protein